MREATVKAAMDEARKFISRANATLGAAKNPAPGCDRIQCAGPRFTGALRRQSLELTRALAEMRKP